MTAAGPWAPPPGNSQPRPRGRPQPWRRPAFWLLLAVIGLAGLATLGVGALMIFLAPRAGAVIVPLALAYGACWVFGLLWLGDPVERRPFWLVGAALAWGGTAAAAVGVGSGYFLDQILAKAISPTFAAVWGAAFVGPTAEEAAKAAGVVLLFLAARPYLCTVWSGAIYGALAGVGFSTVEDITYGVSYADESLPDDVRLGTSVLLLRFVVPGLIGHPAFTAVAGAGIAYAWLRTDRPPGRRMAVLAGASGAAWLMHFAVNSPIASWAAEALAVLPWASAWAGYFLVVTLPAVPALWWLLRVRRADAAMVLALTAAARPAVPGSPVPVEPGSVEPALVAPEPVGPGPVGPGRASADRWAGRALLTAAVAGLAFWPLALASLAGAGLALASGRGRGQGLGQGRGRPLAVACWATAYGGYVWAATALLAVLYP